MINLFQQDIKVHDVVYRGARQGNSSEFKIGLVTKLNEDKRTVRVRWITSGYYARGWLSESPTWQPAGSTGTCSVDTLVLFDADYRRAKYTGLWGLLGWNREPVCTCGVCLAEFERSEREGDVVYQQHEGAHGVVRRT